MTLLSFRKMLQQFFSGASAEERLLPFLAAATYASSGLYLGLFSSGFDFDSVYQAASRLVHGNAGQLYVEFLAYQAGRNPVLYMYPPPVAMLYSPLGFLPRWLAFGLFQLLNHVILWAAIWMFCRTWCNNFAAKRLTVCLVLLFFPLYYCLHLGQSEILLLGCILLAIKWFKEGRFAASSFIFVIAMELKIFLLLFLLYFVLIRSWRYVLWCGLWLFMWGTLSLIWIPVDILHAYLIKLFSPIGIEAFIDNQSLTGFFMRSFTFNTYTRGFADWPEAAGFISKACSLAVIGYYAYVVQNVFRRVRIEETFGLTVITILLSAPLTDTHHLTLLLIPILWRATKGELDGPLCLFYAFFACFIPLWGFKFLSLERGIYYATRFTHPILSIPCYGLAAYWVYEIRRVSRFRYSVV